MTPEEELSQWMTVREAAELLRVTTRTIQRFIESGKLPARRLGTHKLARLRVRRADVEAMLLPAEPRGKGQPRAGQS